MLNVVEACYAPRDAIYERTDRELIFQLCAHPMFPVLQTRTLSIFQLVHHDLSSDHMVQNVPYQIHLQEYANAPNPAGDIRSFNDLYFFGA
jgi:hypothetical protein